MRPPGPGGQGEGRGGGWVGWGGVGGCRVQVVVPHSTGCHGGATPRVSCPRPRAHVAAHRRPHVCDARSKPSVLVACIASPCAGRLENTPGCAASACRQQPPRRCVRRPSSIGHPATRASAGGAPCRPTTRPRGSPCEWPGAQVAQPLALALAWLLWHGGHTRANAPPPRRSSRVCTVYAGCPAPAAADGLISHVRLRLARLAQPRCCCCSKPGIVARATVQCTRLRKSCHSTRRERRCAGSSCVRPRRAAPRLFPALPALASAPAALSHPRTIVSLLRSLARALPSLPSWRAAACQQRRFR